MKIVWKHMKKKEKVDRHWYCAPIRSSNFLVGIRITKKKNLSTRVLCWGLKENLYWTGHEDLETWELSDNERVGKNQRFLGKLFDFFKCFVNRAYISSSLFVLLKTMVISSENCPDNRQRSVLVSNNRPILLYIMYM